MSQICTLEIITKVQISIQIIKDKTDGAVTMQSILNGQIKVNANEYIDKAVSLLNNQLESNNLDTSELPDVDIDFEHNVACGIIIPGTADIQDGSISGLANFCRTGDSELNINVSPAKNQLLFR